MSGVLGGLILKPTSLIPRNGLVAEYLANNNFLDTSGNGYNGVNNNVTFGNDRHSSANSAFVFNGTTAFVNIDAALAGLATNTKGTWSAWVKPVDATPAITEVIICFGDTDGSEHIFISVRAGGKSRASARIAGTTSFTLETTANPFLDNTWIHVALTQNGIEPVIYIGGVAVAQGFVISNNKTSWFDDFAGLDNGRLGDINNNNTGETNHINGSIDDIRIYNRVLSQAEITILSERNSAGVFAENIYGTTTIAKSVTDFIHQTGIFDITIRLSFGDAASTSDFSTIFSTSWATAIGARLNYGNDVSGVEGKLVFIIVGIGSVRTDDLSSILSDGNIHKIRLLGDGVNISIFVDDVFKTLDSDLALTSGGTSDRNFALGLGSGSDHFHVGLIKSVNVINNLGQEIIEYDFTNGDEDTVTNTGADKPATPDMTWVPAGAGIYVAV